MVGREFRFLSYKGAFWKITLAKIARRPPLHFEPLCTNYGSTFSERFAGGFVMKERHIHVEAAYSGMENDHPGRKAWQFYYVRTPVLHSNCPLRWMCPVLVEARSIEVFSEVSQCLAIDRRSVEP